MCFLLFSGGWFVPVYIIETDILSFDELSPGEQYLLTCSVLNTDWDANTGDIFAVQQILALRPR
jgi:hypothetical protein